MPNYTQSNVQQGTFVSTASEDLTGKEGFLAVLSNSSGKQVAGLPAANTAYAFYLIDDGDASGQEVGIRPIESGNAYRIKAILHALATA
jgi:hypothetical protein